MSNERMDMTRPHDPHGASVMAGVKMPLGKEQPEFRWAVEYLSSSMGTVRAEFKAARMDYNSMDALPEHCTWEWFDNVSVFPRFVIPADRLVCVQRLPIDAGT